MNKIILWAAILLLPLPLLAGTGKIATTLRDSPATTAADSRATSPASVESKLPAELPRVSIGATTVQSESYRLRLTTGIAFEPAVLTGRNLDLAAYAVRPIVAIAALNPIRSLVIREAYPDVRLWWESIPGVESYSIYRGSTATFSIEEAVLVGTTRDTSFIDNDILDTDAERYFYRVDPDQ